MLVISPGLVFCMKGQDGYFWRCNVFSLSHHLFYFSLCLLPLILFVLLPSLTPFFPFVCPLCLHLSSPYLVSNSVRLLVQVLFPFLIDAMPAIVLRWMIDDSDPYLCSRVYAKQIYTYINEGIATIHTACSVFIYHLKQLIEKEECGSNAKCHTWTKCYFHISW